MHSLFSSRFFSTRNGAMIVGGFAAALSAVFLLIYLSSYRSSVKSENVRVTVLVAKRLIEKGTPGTLIGQKELFTPTTVPQRELRDGAITDPASFRNSVAAVDIFPGQQLTASEFKPLTSDELSTQISGYERAIAIPLDSAHGLIGKVHTGDHVDVYAGFSVNNGGSGASTAVLRVLMQNALVLDAPSGAGGFASAAASNVVVRANTKQAAAIAFAAENGKVWLALRPTAASKPTRPDLVTLRSLLIGAKPLKYGGLGSEK